MCLYEYRKERTNLQQSNFTGRIWKQVLGLVQITSLTFKAVTLAVVAIVLEPVVFTVSATATAEQAVFSYGGSENISQKFSHPEAKYASQHFSYSKKKIK